MLRRDPEKQAAWQRRGAERYAASRRERGRSAPTRQANAERRAQPRRPRRNDSDWRAQCLALRGAYCRACGDASSGIEMDHIMPRSQGGPSVVENGLPLCPACHAAKTASRLKFRYEWFDADQIAWLDAAGWVRWDDAGQPGGRGWRHFHPLTENQAATRRRRSTEGE